MMNIATENTVPIGKYHIVPKEIMRPKANAQL